MKAKMKISTRRRSQSTLLTWHSTFCPCQDWNANKHSLVFNKIGLIGAKVGLRPASEAYLAYHRVFGDYDLEPGQGRCSVQDLQLKTLGQVGLRYPAASFCMCHFLHFGQVASYEEAFARIQAGRTWEEPECGENSHIRESSSIKQMELG